MGAEETKKVQDNESKADKFVRLGEQFARHGRALTGESPEHTQIVGSVQLNSKGVHREMESEGSCKQISGPTDRNHI